MKETVKTKKHKKTKKAKRLPKGFEYASPNAGVDVQKSIIIHIIFNGENTKGWLHTHGMFVYGMPEVEMRSVPLFLAHAAGELINRVCDYMLNSEDKFFKAGQVFDFGGSVFKLVRAPPLVGGENHYAADGQILFELGAKKVDRWLFEDIEMRCKHCEGGECKEHKTLH